MKKQKHSTGLVMGGFQDHLSYKLPVLNFREGGSTTIFCPALDLSAVGSDLKSAEKAFAEVLELYFLETVESGTLKEDLKRLGWEVGQDKVIPPKISKLISANPVYKRLLSQSNYTQKHKKIVLPSLFNGNNPSKHSPSFV